MRIRFASRAFAVLATLVVIGFGSLFLDQAATLAQSGPPPTPIDTTLDALLARADRDGSVPVIVGLRTSGPFKPEADLPSAAAVNGQKASIAQAQAGILNALAADKKRVLARYQHVPYIALSLDRAGLEHLFASGLASTIKQDTPIRPAMAAETALIHADQVQAAGDDGDGWVVAILDTGIDEAHPYFAGRIVLNQQACFSNEGGFGGDLGGTSLCPNGQGTQTGRDASSGLYAADESVPGCSGGLCDHGTHVAGIAAGNASGVSGAPGSGVAPHALILPVQVFTHIVNPDFCGSAAPCVLTFQSDYMAALDYVLSVKDGIPGGHIAAVNMSIGGGAPATTPCDTDPAKAHIDSLLAAGIPTVIAAGNDGSAQGISNPGCISSAVTVGATDDSDAVAAFSNRKPNMLDLFAPGVNVLSSFPVNTFGPDSGTSMATPMVTGAFADLREGDPSASASTLLTALKATGVLIPVNGTTVPRIDLLAADNALNGVGNPPRPPSSPSPSSGAGGVSLTLHLSWTDVDPDAALAPDPLSYNVYLDTIGSPTTLLAECTGLSAPDCSPAGLSGATTYRWRVVATNSHGLSANGPTWSFTTKDRPPSVPSAPSPAASSAWASMTPALAWTGGDPDLGDTAQYKVYLSTNRIPKTLVCGGLTAPGCTPAHKLSTATTYYWKVVATDSHGQTASGPIWHFTTGFTAPALVAPKGGASLHAGAARLTWRSQRDAAGYFVEVFDDPGLSAGSLVQSGSAIRPFFQTRRLDFGVYFWHVQVKDALGQSLFSAVHSFEVTINQSPANHAVMSTHMPTFHWMPVRGASYELQVFTDNSGEPARNASAVFSTPLTSNWFPLGKKSALPSGTYFWRVRVNGGAWTPAWSFRIR